MALFVWERILSQGLCRRPWTNIGPVVHTNCEINCVMGFGLILLKLTRTSSFGRFHQICCEKLPLVCTRLDTHGRRMGKSEEEFSIVERGRDRQEVITCEEGNHTYGYHTGRRFHTCQKDDCMEQEDRHRGDRMDGSRTIRLTTWWTST